MEKPNARGPGPNRKAQNALGEKVNRKEKTPPPLLEPVIEPVRQPRSKPKV